MRRQHRLIDQPIQSLSNHAAPYITVYVLAEYLEVNPRTVIRMISAGSLHAFKVGREWRVPTGEAQRAFPDRPGHSGVTFHVEATPTQH